MRLARGILTFYGGILAGHHLQESGLACIAGEVTDVRHQVAQAGRTALQEVGDQPNVGVQLGNLKGGGKPTRNSV